MWIPTQFWRWVLLPRNFAGKNNLGVAERTMIGNNVQFAQYIGLSKQYVGRLRKLGRLVIVDGQIDFEKSKKKIAETADISRQNVFDKTKQEPEKPKAAEPKKKSKTPKKRQNAKTPAGKTKTADKPEQPTPEQHESAIAPGMDGGIKEQFNLARAAYQGYQAKLKKIEYERIRGTLGSLDQIQKVGFEIGKIIKTRMATFAIRAAPVVTHETSEKANREYLMREVENVIAEIREELEQKKGG